MSSAMHFFSKGKFTVVFFHLRAHMRFGDDSNAFVELDHRVDSVIEFIAGNHKEQKCCTY